MASATVVDSAAERLYAESIPVVDLRLLSQPELRALSLCSSSAADLRLCDDVVVPKIDRSVFNESAGSRKQTYSRLRLASRKAELHSSSSSSSAAVRPAVVVRPDSADEENMLIVGYLKEMFASEDPNDNLVPVEVEYGESMPEMANVSDTVQEIPIDIVDVGMKRKRGRKPKSEKALEEGGGSSRGGVQREAMVYENGEDRDREIVNKNGVVVDVVALANAEDPYGPELRRKTEGLGTVDALTGFLSELNGEWGSKRKKRRIVDACDFGDALPKGWKLLLCLRRRESQAWLICSRYISPNGRQFVSCKEVSSYLCSFLGLEDADQLSSSNIRENVQFNNRISSGSDADISIVNDNNSGGFVICTSPITSVSTEHKNQVMSVKIASPEDVAGGEILQFCKSNVTLDVKDDLLYHPISSVRTSKRRKLGASICDGVIIKHGQFECQFCHKVFQERHRYNGHVGVHVKSNLKTNEASPVVMTLQKSVDPVFLDGVPRVFEVQASIGHDRNSNLDASNANADAELNSGLLHGKVNTDTVVKTCMDKYGFEDELKMKMNMYNSNLVETCAKQDGVANATVDKLTIMSERCVGNDGNVVSSSLMEEPKPGIGFETGMLNQYDDDRRCNLDHTEDRQPCTSLIQELGIDDKSSVGDNEQIKQIRSPNLCLPAQNDKRFGSVNNLNGVLTSIVQAPKVERGSESCLLPPSGDEQTSSIDNDMDRVSPCSLDVQKLDEVVNSRNNELTVDFGFARNHDMSDEISVASVDQGRISDRCSLVPTQNEQICAVKDNVRGASPHIWDKLRQQKGSESVVFTPCSKEQFDILENKVNSISNSTVEELKFDENKKYTNELIIAFDSSSTRPDVGVLTNIDQDRSFESSSLGLSRNEGMFGVENYVAGVFHNMDEHKQKKHFYNKLRSPSGNEHTFDVENNLSKVSTNTPEKPKLHETQSSDNSELTIAFGSCQIRSVAASGIKADQRTSLADLTFDFKNDVNSVYSSTSEGPGQERNFESSEQACDVENIMDNKVYTGTMWKGPRLADAKYPRNNEPIDPFKWRTGEENILQNGLNDSSSPLLQISGCFPTFDIVPDKGENELFSVHEKFGSISGVHELKSGCSEHLEFDFLNVQTNSLSNDPKILSYDVPMEQGFDTPVWFETEELLPKMTSRHQVSTVCVWCRNEFLHEAVNSGIQTGSIGFMCPTCKAKF